MNFLQIRIMRLLENFSIDKIDGKYNWFGSMLREKYLDEISK